MRPLYADVNTRKLDCPNTQKLNQAFASIYFYHAAPHHTHTHTNTIYIPTKLGNPAHPLFALLAAFSGAQQHIHFQSRRARNMWNRELDIGLFAHTVALWRAALFIVIVVRRMFVCVVWCVRAIGSIYRPSLCTYVCVGTKRVVSYGWFNSLSNCFYGIYTCSISFWVAILTIAFPEKHNT